MTSVSPSKAVLAYLRQRLQDLYGNRLETVMLFGSWARDEVHAESDLDVLIVLTGSFDRYAEHRLLGELSVEIIERFGIILAPVIVSNVDFRTGDWPLLRNVHQEGVAL